MQFERGIDTKQGNRPDKDSVFLSRKSQREKRSIYLGDGDGDAVFVKISGEISSSHRMRKEQLIFILEKKSLVNQRGKKKAF